MYRYITIYILQYIRVCIYIHMLHMCITIYIFIYIVLQYILYILQNICIDCNIYICICNHLLQPITICITIYIYITYILQITYIYTYYRVEIYDNM